MQDRNTTVVVRAWADRDVMDAPSFAAVDLSPGYAALLIERMGLINELRQGDDDVYCVEYWSGSATWCSHCSDRVAEMLDDVSDAPKCADYGRLLTIPEEHQLSVDLRTIEVMEDGVRWKAHLKNSDVLLTTDVIPLAFLEELAEQWNAAKEETCPAAD